MSPYKNIAYLLTIFFTLYISCLWFIYFAAGNLYLLISLTYFLPPTPLPSSNHLFILGIYNSVSVLLCLFSCFIFLDSTYKWNHTKFNFLCLTYVEIYILSNTQIVIKYVLYTLHAC